MRRGVCAAAMLITIWANPAAGKSNARAGANPESTSEASEPQYQMMVPSHIVAQQTAAPKEQLRINYKSADGMTRGYYEFSLVGEKLVVRHYRYNPYAGMGQAPAELSEVDHMVDFLFNGEMYLTHKLMFGRAETEYQVGEVFKSVMVEVADNDGLVFANASGLVAADAALDPEAGKVFVASPLFGSESGVFMIQDEVGFSRNGVRVFQAQSDSGGTFKVTVYPEEDADSRQKHRVLLESQAASIQRNTKPERPIIASGKNFYIERADHWTSGSGCVSGFAG